MTAKVEKVRVDLKREIDDSYELVIGSGLMERLAQDLRKKPLASRYVVIADAQVMKLYGNGLTEVLRKAGVKADRVAFPAGEASKSRKMKQVLEEHMLSLGLGRDSCVIACGGGVTGDLAGFTAATFMRGVPWVQFPTTLLAMVDASIGGKTGIDAPEGKNLIGAFHQPKAVYIDVSCLDTLPRRHLQAGIAEVVKHGVILSEPLFADLEKSAESMLEGNSLAQVNLIRQSCEIKAQVVMADEKESDFRKVLNYGHTIGHAVESVSNYSLLHGEAVALGMAMEAALSVHLGFMPEKDLVRQNALLKKIGLPVNGPVVLKALLGRNVRPKEILEYTHHDKKSRQGMVEYVLPAKIGDTKRLKKKSTVPLDDKTVISFLRTCIH